MLTTRQKKKVIEKYQLEKKDTGSPEVQIALLTDNIGEVSGHLKYNPKDNASRLGLVKMVHQRKKLLTYLSKKDKDRYKKLAKKLDLKKKD